jgi:diguanylate cyclase (GGDEF)-like protein
LVQFHYTPFILPLAVSAAFCLAMLVVAWRNRVEPVAPWFAATILALLAWTVGYIFELMATGLQAKVAWANLEYIATIALPMFWLQVVLTYTRQRGLSRRAWLVLGLLGTAILVGIFVNPARLFRIAPTLATHGSLTALHPDYGPIWSFGWVPFVYGLLLLAAYALVRTMLHSHRFQVRQSTAMVAASLLPLAGGTVYALGLSPWPEYNPAMAVVSISGLLMAYALFSSHLFELAPLARDSVIESLADGVLVIDRRGRLVDTNPTALAAFPELSGQSFGQPITTLLAERGEVVHVLRHALATLGRDSAGRQLPPALSEVETRAGCPSDAVQRIYSMLITPVRNGAGTPLGLAAVLRDVSERVELLDEALRLATTDSLTGVLTRRRFIELAEKEVRRATHRSRPLTLLVFDVDHLKAINDTRGHTSGDRLLVSLAAASHNVLRDGDLLGRLGGDEFCVLLSGADADEGQRIAERLRLAASDCWDLKDDSPWRASVSIGLATCHDWAEDGFNRLFEAADRALYVAKNRGRDCVAVATMPAAPD